MGFEEPKTEMINLTKFAEMVGCDRSRVSQAIKDRLISEENVVYDGTRAIGVKWRSAMDEWAMNYDQGKRQEASKVGETLIQHQEKIRGEELTIDQLEDLDKAGVRPLHDSKRIEAHHKAEIARMDKEEREGSLVRKDAVKKELHSLGVEVRVAMQSIPDRVVDLVMGKTDRNEVIRIIAAEVDEQLNKLTEVVERFEK